MEDTLDLEHPDAVLEYLEPAIRAIDDALDHGVSLADSTLSEMRFDPHLWAHLARYGACQRLAEVESEGWRRGRELRNSGIELVRGPLVLRVLKSQGNQPPNPGGNVARRAFWTQGWQMRLPIDQEGVLFPTGANFILDWTVDPQRSRLLALSKPAGIWKYRGAPKLEWRRPVVLDEGKDLRFVASEEDVTVESVFDATEFEADEESG